MENSKNNKILYILIATVIIAVVASGILYYLKNKSNSDSGSNQNVTNSIVENNNQGENYDEIKGEMMEKVDVDDLISKIKPEYKKDPKFQECIGMDMGIKTCLMQLIEEKIKKENNESYCNDLLTQNDINLCKDSYLSQKAEENKDLTLCEKVSDKDGCRLRVYVKKGIEGNDWKVCEEIKDEYTKQSCKRDVITEVARKTKNINLCDKLIIKRKDEFSEGQGEIKEVVDENDVLMCKDTVGMEIENEKQMEMMNEMENQEKYNEYEGQEINSGEEGGIQTEEEKEDVKVEENTTINTNPDVEVKPVENGENKS